MRWRVLPWSIGDGVLIPPSSCWKDRHDPVIQGGDHFLPDDSQSLVWEAHQLQAEGKGVYWRLLEACQVHSGNRSRPTECSKKALITICHQCIILWHVAVFPTYITCTFYNFIFYLAAFFGTGGIRIHFTWVLFQVLVLLMPYFYCVSVARSGLRHPKVTHCRLWVRMHESQWPDWIRWELMYQWLSKGGNCPARRTLVSVICPVSPCYNVNR